MDAARELVRVGTERYYEVKNASARYKLELDPEAQAYYDDIQTYPHIFVLGCLMDRQISAIKAWMIPYDFCQHIGSFEMQELSKITLEETINWFVEKHPHRFNVKMAEVFYEGVQRIHNQYDDDASKIWSDKPRSATAVYRFLQFKGAGIKIATMAVNILARDYHVELADHYSLDISPDVHVKRVFYRLGLTSEEDDREAVIYKARELNPEFPGIIDLFCWETGYNICKPTNPLCDECPLSHCCAYHKSLSA